MTVGMENLPNVFINKIQVYDKSNGRRIVTQLHMYDNRRRSRRSWRGRINDLKIKISYVTDKQAILDLNSGAASLFDYQVGQTRTKIVSANDFEFTPFSGEFALYSLNLEEDIVNFYPENLNIYAACFIDGLSFENPMFDKFYGPMAAERVLVGGQINSFSSYFYYPDTNEEYGGPVHQKPDGTYMEGSVHTEVPHKEVALVLEENYKIQYFESEQTMASTPTGVPNPMDQLNDQLESAAYVPPPQTQVAPTGVPTPTHTVRTAVAPTGVPTPSIPSGGGYS